MADPRNDIQACVAQFKTDLDAMTTKSGSDTIAAFPRGVAVVPESHIDKWLEQTLSGDGPWMCIVWSSTSMLPGDEIPVARAIHETFDLGYVLVADMKPDRKGDFTTAWNALTDMDNRIKNQIKTSAATLNTAGTINAILTQDYFEWGEPFDSVEVEVEYAVTGSRFRLGNQITPSRTH